MRRAISIMLAATLVLSPVRVVLAQARVQESPLISADSLVIQPMPARIRVPVIEPGSGAALLLAASGRTDALIQDTVLQSFPREEQFEVWKYVLGLFVSAVGLYVLARVKTDWAR